MSTPSPDVAEQLAPEERAEVVRTMFGDIAGKYDATNTVLSGGMHHLWRKKALREMSPTPDAKLLDVCCGTGDLAFTLAGALGPSGEVVGTDFTPQMITLANEKAGKSDVAAKMSFQVADAMALPFEDNTFDGATVSFGIRNVVDPTAGLAEMRRVVKPGGKVLVLEFGQPAGLFGMTFRWYSRVVMPAVGGLMTGNRAAYEYLPRTSAAFPAGDLFVENYLQPAGLTHSSSTPLLWGLAWLYVGEVP
ncbi:MAG: bifunctional demethylmenaquinone methyltransferase/2-methoxy-6-polyprenyl-1,4-benzoquinol methylase UbiE [Deltaproteobacteria bacterium]|nr:bifunctional demethylmenaquinone methyltransferase/2-methoxy-6-polyprenyl-1,4-benzoquinol methylase UbiE [Deltaproteobacteria bacterium]